MIRKIFALWLVLLFCTSLASAQNGKKFVSYLSAFHDCWKAPCALYHVQVEWEAPTKAPDSYRISWTTTSRWRKTHRPNTLTQGSAIVTEPRYIIDRLYVPPGETLRIRVRARYDGERNGKWNCCLDLKAKLK